MKKITSYILRAVFLFLIILLSSGCTITHKLNSTVPSMNIGSPLIDVPEGKFALKEFTDTRGYDPYTFMKKWGAHAYKLDKPVTSIVSQSICKEFERNGHICVINGTELSDYFTITGSILNYWFDFDPARKKPSKGTVEVNLSITSSNLENDRKKFTKTYRGEYLHKMTGLSGGFDYIGGTVFYEIMQEALKRMLSEMSTDSDLIDFLMGSKE